MQQYFFLVVSFVALSSFSVRAQTTSGTGDTRNTHCWKITDAHECGEYPDCSWNSHDGVCIVSGLADGVTFTNKLNCQSVNYQPSVCPAGRGITFAYLEGQESSSSCIKGVTWGFNADEVWVSHGCRGRFTVLNMPNQ